MGCSNSNNLEKYNQFLSDDASKYSILIVGTSDDNDDGDWNAWLKENNITNVKSLRHETIVNKSEEEKYDYLKLKKYPAYVVFNNKEIAYKTYTEADLVQYLWNNAPK